MECWQYKPGLWTRLVCTKKEIRIMWSGNGSKGCDFAMSLYYIYIILYLLFYSSNIYHLFGVRNCSSFSTVRLLDIRCLCPIKLTNDCIRKLYLGVVPRVAEISGWVKITLRIVSALPGRGRRQQPCGEREDYWIGGCPESTSLLLIPSGNLFFS